MRRGLFLLSGELVRKTEKLVMFGDVGGGPVVIVFEDAAGEDLCECELPNEGDAFDLLNEWREAKEIQDRKEAN